MESKVIDEFKMGERFKIELTELSGGNDRGIIFTVDGYYNATMIGGDEINKIKDLPDVYVQNFLNWQNRRYIYEHGCDTCSANFIDEFSKLDVKDKEAVEALYYKYTFTTRNADLLKDYLKGEG